MARWQDAKFDQKKRQPCDGITLCWIPNESRCLKRIFDSIRGMRSFENLGIAQTGFHITIK